MVGQAVHIMSTKDAITIGLNCPRENPIYEASRTKPKPDIDKAEIKNYSWGNMVHSPIHAIK